MPNSNAAVIGLAAGPQAVPESRLPEYVFRDARSWGAKPALIEAGSRRVMSYARLADTVSVGASWLAEMGMRPGEVLAVCVGNSIEFVVDWHAALLAGAVATPANHACSTEEIADHLLCTGARWLVTTADLFNAKLAAAAREVPCLTGVFVLGADASPLAPGVGLQLTVRRFDVPSSGGVKAPGFSPGAALLPTSSGTGVALTHRDLIAHLRQLRRAQPADEGEVSLVADPMSAIDVMQTSVNAQLARGATIVILPDLALHGTLADPAGER